METQAGENSSIMHRLHWFIRLPQIQDSANYLKDASEKLEVIKGVQLLDKESTTIKTPTEIRKAFEGLIACLRRAESVLVLPQPTTALQIYNAEQKVLYMRCCVAMNDQLRIIDLPKTCIAWRCNATFPHELCNASLDNLHNVANIKESIKCELATVVVFIHCTLSHIKGY